jgi:two-component system KDP operon response regulator KdpE
MKALVVEDDPRIGKTLEANLRARGYEADLAASGEQALRLAAGGRPDVVILDLGLPGMDGLDVVRELRGWTRVPIVVVSARGTDEARVKALDLGADDYVTKPFSIDELFARVRAVLRRTRHSDLERVVLTPHFQLDFDQHTATRDGVPVELTATQWRILDVLLRDPGRVVTYQQLAVEVWGPSYGMGTDSLRVLLTGIRRRLEPDPSVPRYFVNVAGVGVRFTVNDGAGGPSGA